MLDKAHQSQNSCIETACTLYGEWEDGQAVSHFGYRNSQHFATNFPNELNYKMQQNYAKLNFNRLLQNHFHIDVDQDTNAVLDISIMNSMN